MSKDGSDNRRPARALSGGKGAAMAAALGAGAAGSVAVAAAAARRFPPKGQFVQTGSGALHLVEAGPGRDREKGPPVILIHGCATMLEDWLSSPAIERLAAERRVLVVDRPGYGHSERRRGANHRALGQAAAIAEAAAALGIKAPVVAGHGHGALIALAWAQAAPGTLSGAVLIAGRYYRAPGLGRSLAAGVRQPGIPGMIRHAVGTAAAQAALPVTLRRLFAPRPVPARFREMFPAPLAVRPAQLAAAAADRAAAESDAAALLAQGRPALPLAMLAGREDRLCDPRANTLRYAAAFGIAPAQLVPGAGHMVHHSAPGRTAAAILRLKAGLIAAPAS